MYCFFLEEEEAAAAVEAVVVENILDNVARGKCLDMEDMCTKEVEWSRIMQLLGMGRQ